jgi:hypothetical protein
VGKIKFVSFVQFKGNELTVKCSGMRASSATSPAPIAASYVASLTMASVYGIEGSRLRAYRLG